MTVTADEFIRRFLLHVLPKGFVRIRHFGVMANYRRSESIDLCRKLLGMTPLVRSTDKRSDNAIRLVPHLPEPSDRHRETDGRPTVLEDLIERFRQYFLAVLQSGFFDVLWHACADVCLTARATAFPIAAARISPENLRPTTSAKEKTFPAPTRGPTLVDSRDRENRGWKLERIDSEKRHPRYGV
jgi:hypothetical protein